MEIEDKILKENYSPSNKEIKKIAKELRDLKLEKQLENSFWGRMLKYS